MLELPTVSCFVLPSGGGGHFLAHVRFSSLIGCLQIAERRRVSGPGRLFSGLQEEEEREEQEERRGRTVGGAWAADGGLRSSVWRAAAAVASSRSQALGLGEPP